ncbi:ankyrin repeat domain-containing protein [Pusillimonas sp. TS35]|uniref:ankyrin repeat domain-containing protein n=1 Tax=Paracandidimonas lactea TaxID=2895524 RepID=UPI00136E7885|nr:ankyrin repeat domain-containing protein [Paracandidimonas lactea]MYN12169.1 ankyrin repeat domain-containing protein [Pusillimonas sp. TS35]
MRSLLSRFLAFAAAMLLTIAAQAAVPQSWWVDIANDRAAKVEEALRQGADPNAVSPDGQPGIMLAIRSSAWKVFDVLAADRRTSLNAINKNRETPLMYLAVVGQTERARALIHRGAQVNRLGWTPLQYAASTGQLETVKMLIANKAIVNAPGPDGTTALMMAARAGSEDVVRYLLDHGADATMQNLQKMDAADWARLKKHDGLAKKLDDLSARVQADRSAKRVAADQPETFGVGSASVNEGGVGANNATNTPAQAGAPGAFGIPGVDTLPPDMPRATPPQPPAPPAAAPSAKQGTSRYFDLDRFNKPSTP